MDQQELEALARTNAEGLARVQEAGRATAEAIAIACANLQTMFDGWAPIFAQALDKIRMLQEPIAASPASEPQCLAGRKVLYWGRPSAMALGPGVKGVVQGRIHIHDTGSAGFQTANGCRLWRSLDCSP
jgi:hypothetical protein